MEPFAPYDHAIVAMAGAGTMLLIMGPLTGRRKANDGLAPGATPPADYANATYRWHRAYSNLVESLGIFVAVTLAAILAGANPFWVNTLASGFLVMRVVMAVIHIKGIGKADMSVRSFAYVAGWIMCLALAVMAILGVFTGG